MKLNDAGYESGHANERRLRHGHADGHDESKQTIIRSFTYGSYSFGGSDIALHEDHMMHLMVVIHCNVQLHEMGASSCSILVNS